MPPIGSWAVGTDEFPRSERKPLTVGVSGEWRPVRTSFRIQDKSRSEGRLFGSQGQMPPIRLEAVCEQTSFHARDGTRPKRRPSGSRGRMRSTHSQQAGAGCFDPPVSDRDHPSFVWESGAGSGSPPPPLGERTRIACNTYSVPYKGKTLKKRLSPKSVNTLIHQCVTFYIFLIFQYLSLWKSVFSRN